MLILICKVIGFFQGILKGKKSEFNYHYSKKHHGTERLRLAHVCFTPLSKMWAGGAGRGGNAGCTPLPPAPPAPPSQRPRHARQPRAPPGTVWVGFHPKTRPVASPRLLLVEKGAPARPYPAWCWPQAGAELGGSRVSTGTARVWKGFLSPSCFVFTRMDFQQLLPFFFFSGKTSFPIIFLWVSIEK